MPQFPPNSLRRTPAFGVTAALLALSCFFPAPFAAGQSGAPATASGRPSRAHATNKVLPVVLFTTLREPQENAFSFSAPQDWQTSASVSRRSAVDLTFVVRTAPRSGRIQIFLNDPDIVPHEVPNQLTMMAGVREGQAMRAAWGGPILVERFRTGAEFAQEYVRKKLCAQPDFTFGGNEAHDTEVMNAEIVPIGRQAGVYARASVGDSYFRCGSDLGYVTATTLYAAPERGPGATIWVVMQVSGFVVKQEVDASYAMYVLQTLNSSFHVDPQWEAQAERQSQQLTSAVTRMQNAVAANLAQQAAASAAQDRSSVVHGNDIDVMSGWEKREHEMDTIEEKDAEVRRGVTVTEDPIWGSRTVSNDYNYYWTRADNSIIGTATDTPPDYSSGWRLMTTH
jgi:hypothetical protein